MKVTAFHLAGKVEEAARSYFSNSFVFSSRKIDVDRVFDFRKGSAAMQFFVHDGPERVPMGGIEFFTIQDRDNKIALQCRTNVLPAEKSRQFFIILPSDQEQYSQYSRLAEMLSREWDADVNAYLPRHEDAPPPPAAPKTLDDEYASLSPEEIEAITGVKPEPKGAAPEAAKPAASGDVASEDDIQRLMGMMMGGGAAPAPKEEAPAGGMSMDEIEALTRQVQQSAESAPPKAEEPSEMSAEDIWKQINGGK